VAEIINAKYAERINQMIDVTLKKAATITFNQGKGNSVTFERNKTKGISEADKWILEKIENFNKSLPGAFVVETEVESGKLPKGWKKFGRDRLEKTAKSFGISNADDTEAFPAKEDLINALQEQIDSGVLKEE